jgi:hypothetical protein
MTTPAGIAILALALLASAPLTAIADSPITPGDAHRLNPYVQDLHRAQRDRVGHRFDHRP